MQTKHPNENLIWTLQLYRDLYGSVDQLYTLLSGAGTPKYSSELTTEGHFKHVMDNFDDRVKRLILEAGLKYSPDMISDFLHDEIGIDTIINHL